MNQPKTPTTVPNEGENMDFTSLHVVNGNSVEKVEVIGPFVSPNETRWWLIHILHKGMWLNELTFYGETGRSANGWAVASEPTTSEWGWSIDGSTAWVNHAFAAALRSPDPSYAKTADRDEAFRGWYWKAISNRRATPPEIWNAACDWQLSQQQPPRLEWTEEKPTELGWYWYLTQDGANEKIGHVVDRGYGLRLVSRGRDHLLSSYERFAGPIPVPGATPVQALTVEQRRLLDAAKIFAGDYYGYRITNTDSLINAALTAYGSTTQAVEGQEK